MGLNSGPWCWQLPFLTTGGNTRGSPHFILTFGCVTLWWLKENHSWMVIIHLALHNNPILSVHLDVIYLRTLIDWLKWCQIVKHVNIIWHYFWKSVVMILDCIMSRNGNIGKNFYERDISWYNEKLHLIYPRHYIDFV